MTDRLPHLDLVVLARLRTGGESPPTPRDISSSVRRFGSTDADAEHITASCARLQRAGLIDASRHLVGDATRRLSTELNGDVSSWKDVVGRLLPALALGVSTGSESRKFLADRDALAAAIVSRALEWWRTGRPPSISALGDRMVWTGMHLRGNAKRVPSEIRAVFACRLLGVEGLALDAAVRQLAARAVGAPRTDLNALRDAIVGRWLDSTPWAHIAVPADSPPAVTPVDTAVPIASAPGGPIDLRAFAEAVRRVVSAASDGQFSDDRVFIAAAWRRLQGQQPIGDMPLEIFKDKLVAAHRAGLLVLHRADLAGVMDPIEVATSETLSAGARYHFVEREALP